MAFILLRVMIKFLLILSSTLLLFIHSQGQIPEGYYNGTENLSGEDLQWTLYNIIKDHKIFPYTASTTDVWDILKETDQDTVNPANVICIYSGKSVNAAQEYNDGNGWTREHVWAKSRGDFGTEPGPGTDVHHLRPEINDMNSYRSNRWFANCSVPVMLNNVTTGCFIDAKKFIFKPRPEVMGDVARMIFYMATRYKGKNGEPNLTVIDYIPVDNYTKDPIHALLTDLLEWHHLDPVDDWERRRNDIIYYQYQNNRNPFIDYPEFADLIWNPQSTKAFISTTPDTVATVGQPYRYEATVAFPTETQYQVAFTLTEGPEWLTLTDNGDNTATLSGTPQEQHTGNYFVKITGYYADNETVTQSFYIDVKSLVEVSNELSTSITIYPNPATNYVYIGGSFSSASVYAASGQLITNNILQSPFTIDNLHSGFYVIQVFDGSAWHRFKLLKP